MNQIEGESWDAGLEKAASGADVPAPDRQADGDEELARSRRDVLKKAAVAAAVAGAAWTAPHIEGFSIVPDYAAAGTFRGTIVVHEKVPNAAVGGNQTCWGFAGPGFNCPNRSQAIPTASPISATVPGNNANGKLDAKVNVSNLPATETINSNWSGGSAPPGSAPIHSGTIQFDYSSMDPPFNVCRVNRVSTHHTSPNGADTGDLTPGVNSLNYGGPNYPVTVTNTSNRSNIAVTTNKGYPGWVDQITVTIVCT